jgi:hypothetical protein
VQEFGGRFCIGLSLAGNIFLLDFDALIAPSGGSWKNAQDEGYYIEPSVLAIALATLALRTYYGDCGCYLKCTLLATRTGGDSCSSPREVTKCCANQWTSHQLLIYSLRLWKIIYSLKFPKT